MKILQSGLAVTKNTRKKVRFSQGQFRGRPEQSNEIYEVVEEKPCAYIMNGQMIVHPSLYRELRAARDTEILNRPTFDYSTPSYTNPLMPRENLSRYWDLKPFGIRSPLANPLFNTGTMT